MNSIQEFMKNIHNFLPQQEEIIWEFIYLLRCSRFYIFCAFLNAHESVKSIPEFMNYVHV